MIGTWRTRASERPTIACKGEVINTGGRADLARVPGRSKRKGKPPTMPPRRRKRR
jgi:hypothetical protein